MDKVVSLKEYRMEKMYAAYYHKVDKTVEIKVKTRHLKIVK